MSNSTQNFVCHLTLIDLITRKRFFFVFSKNRFSLNLFFFFIFGFINQCIHFSTKNNGHKISHFLGNSAFIERTKNALIYSFDAPTNIFYGSHFIREPNDWIIHYGTGVWLFNKCQAVWKYGTRWIFINMSYIHGNVAWNLTPFSPSFFPHNFASHLLVFAIE